MYLPITASVSFGSLFVALLYASAVSENESEPVPRSPAFVRVLLGYVCLFSCFLMAQSAIKFYAFSRIKMEQKKKGSHQKSISFRSVKYGDDGRKYHTLTADRCVGNFMEQGPLFLILFTLNSIFTDTQSASVLGWMWLLTRSYYPFVFEYGAPVLFLSTMPGYFILVLLAKPLFAYALF